MEITILGGGLAGLSAAYHLQDKNHSYEIYEKEEHAGGLCRSLRQDGFIFDIGPHLLFSKDEYVQHLSNILLKDNLAELVSKAGQYSYGTYVGYPYTVNMYGLPVEIVKQCLLGFIEASYRQKTEEPKNYEEWCYSNFGKGFAECFMFPYARKIWTVEPSTMSTDWIGKRIVLPALEQVIDGSLRKTEKTLNYITTFRYPKQGGIQALIDGFLKNVRSVNGNREVAEIDTSSKSVSFKDGTVINYEAIISSIPLPELSKIIKDIPSSVRKAMDSLIHNSVYIVNLGLNRKSEINYQWIYYDAQKDPFYRIHFPTSLSEQMGPRGMASISAEIAYSRFKPLNKEEVVEKTIESLLKTGVIHSRTEIISIGVFNAKYAYAIYDTNRASAVALIRDYLKRQRIFTCGRFGEWAYLWMDQTILSGKNAAEEVSALSVETHHKQ